MDETTVRRLVALNEAFYARFAAPFAASRAAPQPGYERLLAYAPRPGGRVLDVGCGEGRFRRFLRAQGIDVDYTGVDFAPALLALGDASGHLVQRDLSRPDSLADLGRFNLIVCLSTLQHIPGGDNRARLVAEMGARLLPGARLVLANWQFMGSQRQRRKIQPWPVAGLAASDVEPGDYLLSWQRGGVGLRYVALVDEEATRRLAAGAGLDVVAQFRSDGREGDLNLYTILAPGFSKVAYSA